MYPINSWIPLFVEDLELSYLYECDFLILSLIEWWIMLAVEILYIYVQYYPIIYNMHVYIVLSYPSMTRWSWHLFRLEGAASSSRPVVPPAAALPAGGPSSQEGVSGEVTTNHDNLKRYTSGQHETGHSIEEDKGYSKWTEFQSAFFTPLSRWEHILYSAFLFDLRWSGHCFGFFNAFLY